MRLQHMLRTAYEVIFAVMSELRIAVEEMLTIVTPGIILSMKSLTFEVGILNIKTPSSSLMRNDEGFFKP